MDFGRKYGFLAQWFSAYVKSPLNGFRTIMVYEFTNYSILWGSIVSCSAKQS